MRLRTVYGIIEDDGFTEPVYFMMRLMVRSAMRLTGLFLCSGILCLYGSGAFGQMRELPTTPVKQPAAVRNPAGPAAETPAKPAAGGTASVLPPLNPSLSLLPGINEPAIDLPETGVLPGTGRTGSKPVTGTGGVKTPVSSPNSRPNLYGASAASPSNPLDSRFGIPASAGLIAGGGMPASIPLPPPPLPQDPPSRSAGSETAAAETAFPKPASVMETETEDQKFERNLQTLRASAEKMTDPAARAAELKKIIQWENARKTETARRMQEEEDADLFETPRLKESLLKEGWCLLFDQQTSFGWKTQSSGHYGGGRFLFQNGEIQSDPYHPGLLYTTMLFGEFDLQFDFWAEKDAEILLLLKTPPSPKDLHTSCYTAVLNSAKRNRPRGLLLGRHRFSDAELVETRRVQETRNDGIYEKENAWHSVAVQCSKGNLRIWVDNQETAACSEAKPIAVGHIGFLAAKGKVRIQNVLWRSAVSFPLLEAERGPALRTSRGSKLSRTKEGVLQFSGPGVLESKKKLGDFVLQFEYYQGTASAAAGVFVRALPEQPQTGYEISMQNVPTRQDREAAVGVDAGSFKNIKDARYIRAKDLEWNYMTIAAVGRQFQTWLNGVPVCLMKDPRKDLPKNPEEGPFLLPGTVQFYVPNEDITVRYRNINFADIRAD
ncbi:MAG: DUF1080 domain-containing protein [Planctomycetaceae bacterium]|jgi:hypothetical protein|nr:DUF1080 domain-containing protein [Planctomycetaceae bacterium]